MDLLESVESLALDAFERLGRAEASVHGTELDETHFHEVGADDAIADVVGAALLLDDLDPERVVTTPVATGGGEVEMSHGVYPVPAPATTTEVAAGWRRFLGSRRADRPRTPHAHGRRDPRRGSPRAPTRSPTSTSTPLATGRATRPSRTTRTCSGCWSARDAIWR